MMTELRARIGLVVALVLVASAALLAPARAAGAPRGIHLAFGADPRTSATIVWFTDGGDNPGTHAEYGAGSLTTSVTGTSALAPGEYPGNAKVRTHEVLLTGLPPGTAISYRVGSPSAWSAVHTFTTAPAEDLPFRFTAFADHGTDPSAVGVTQGVIAADPDFHVVAGDLSYAQPSTPTFPEWHVWDTWFTQLEPLAARVPFMTAPGNHECEAVGCTASYRARLALPGAELYYAFDYANAHILVMNSDRATLTQERSLVDALAFAEADLLDASQRKRAGEIDWIFVVQHHPLYGSQGGDPAAEALERRFNPFWIAAEERMLHAYGVDVLIAGHNHHFERSKPMALGTPTTDETHTYTDPRGFIQVITGGGGRPTRGHIQPPPSWSAARSTRFEFMRFDVDGKRLTVTALAADGAPDPILDTWTITRT